MKKTVLQHGRLNPVVEARLAAVFDVVPLWKEPNPLEFLRVRGKDFVAMVASAGHGVKADVIKALPSSRAIASFGVGYDSIDVAFARRQNVAVSYTPDVLNDCVADLAWGAC